MLLRELYCPFCGDETFHYVRGQENLASLKDNNYSCVMCKNELHGGFWESKRFKRFEKFKEIPRLLALTENPMDIINFMGGIRLRN